MLHKVVQQLPSQEEKKVESSIPLIPDFSPMNFTMVSLAIQTSNKPSSIKIGGSTIIISLKLNFIVPTASKARLLSNKKVIPRTITTTINTIYFLTNLILTNHPSNDNCYNKRKYKGQRVS